MSELKPYIGPHPTDHTLTEYYLKSEADKEIAELIKACNSKDEWCLHTLKENRHHKYKRCLAMAKYCYESAMWLEECGVTKYATFMLRWQKRWQELAERFKESV